MVLPASPTHTSPWCTPYPLKLLIPTALSLNRKRKSCPQLLRMQEVDNLLCLVIPAILEYNRNTDCVKVHRCPTCPTQASPSAQARQPWRAPRLLPLPSSNPRCFPSKPQQRRHDWLVFGFRLATHRPAASAEQPCSCLLCNLKKQFLWNVFVYNSGTGLGNPLKPVVSACAQRSLYTACTLWTPYTGFVTERYFRGNFHSLCIFIWALVTNAMNIDSFCNLITFMKLQHSVVFRADDYIPSFLTCWRTLHSPPNNTKNITDENYEQEDLHSTGDITLASLLVHFQCDTGDTCDNSAWRGGRGGGGGWEGGGRRWRGSLQQAPDHSWSPGRDNEQAGLEKECHFTSLLSLNRV